MNQSDYGHIKAVFFDHDDTLVGTINPKWKQHKFIAKKYYNKHLTDEDIAMYWGIPLDDLLRNLYSTDNIEQAKKHTLIHHEEYPKDLFETTVPLLEALRNNNLLIGVVTATNRDSFEHDLMNLDLPKSLFDFTQTADETSFHKPDPKVFEPIIKWLQKKNISPQEVLYVGDGLHDMHAAIGAGFSFIGVETGLTTKEHFKKHKVKSIAHSGLIQDILIP